MPIKAWENGRADPAPTTCDVGFPVKAEGECLSVFAKQAISRSDPAAIVVCLFPRDATQSGLPAADSIRSECRTSNVCLHRQ